MEEEFNLELSADDFLFGADLAWDDVEALAAVIEAEREAEAEKSSVALAKGRLDWSPKKNWVENAGGLPRYIEDIALALIRDHGFTRERAISTAINRVKKWASGVGDVKADTRAKAAKALAEWEALKAKSKARKAAK